MLTRHVAYSGDEEEVGSLHPTEVKMVVGVAGMGSKVKMADHFALSIVSTIV